MAKHSASYNTSPRARRASRHVHEHMVGTHVERPQQREPRRRDAVEAIRKKARFRRAVAGIVGVSIVVIAALVMAFIAFRGSVGSSMALRDSDASKVLIAPAAEEPYFLLVSVELGSVAKPLDNSGPDILMLVRIDNENQDMAIISIPWNLQVTNDGKSTTLAELASQGDAKLITAVSQFTKLEIAHFLKIDEQGMTSMIDALGGIELSVDQVIDDPQAGDVYIPAGQLTLNGTTALQYLRAENLKLGRQDQISHQLTFATKIIERIFSGNLSTNMDAISSSLQTDMTLSDIEAIGAWLAGRPVSQIIITSLPGYISGVTSVDKSNQTRFVGSYEEFEEMLAMIERGEVPPMDTADGIEAAQPDTVTVEVQNGTTIAGAAALTAEALTDAGFKVTEVGNAEQQVYTETLVIYNDDRVDRAKAVIDALGVGRAVNSGAYYSFPSDVLVIIGSDFAPIS